MTDYVIANSKELHDVKKASLKDLNFTSQKNLFKIQQHGTWSMTLTYSYFYDSDWGFYFHKWEGQTSISHNLGYSPTFEVWGKFTSLGENNYRKWTFINYTWWGSPEVRNIFSNSSDIIITYYSAIRQDLYEWFGGLPQENIVVDGIYSIYVDPIL